MTKRNISSLQSIAKPTAQRHAKRMDLKRKLDKPEFDPAETDRWIDRNGKFTIPPSKGKLKSASWLDAFATSRMSGLSIQEATKVANEYVQHTKGEQNRKPEAEVNAVSGGKFNAAFDSIFGKGGK